MALCDTVRVTRLSEFTLVASVFSGMGQKSGGGDVVAERGDGLQDSSVTPGDEHDGGDIVEGGGGGGGGVSVGQRYHTGKPAQWRGRCRVWRSVGPQCRTRKPSYWRGRRRGWRSAGPQCRTRKPAQWRGCHTGGRRRRVCHRGWRRRYVGRQ